MRRNAEEAGTMEKAQPGGISFPQRFQERATWTARIVTGTLIFITVLFAAYTVISMFFSVYIGPLQELTQWVIADQNVRDDCCRLNWRLHPYCAYQAAAIW